MVTASAPAKLILCGEHAVVYGRPAIAIPLGDIRASARVEPGPAGAGLRLLAPDLGEAWSAVEAPDNPLSELALTVTAQLGLAGADLTITLGSAIPIASGMGSGAAIGTALVRALADHAGHRLPPAEVAALVYASERRFHGTPSGIDNTVVAHERAIWFVRAMDHGPRTTDHGPQTTVPLIEPIAVGRPLTLVVGDTGVRSATRLPVGAVRTAWQADPETYEALFDAVGDLVTRARVALAVGEPAILGHLLDANQALLERMGVSSPELKELVAAARGAGALGAKLSGAGWGGVMLALVADETRAAVEEALWAAGAARVLTTTVSGAADPV
jgi:mevalonate kinase